MDQILQGDCRELLKTIPSESVDCCVTSPPYWGLRDYGVDGQLGLETSHHEYVCQLVSVFQEVRRVLKPNATLWLNLGDTFAGSWGNSGHRPELDGTPSYQRCKHGSYINRGGWDQRRCVPPNNRIPGLKAKDLVGIPWRVALALQEDGWWLRSDIIWAKGNPMPESVTDRPTRSHEYLFLLSKSRKYFYDSEAIKEPSCSGHPSGNGFKRSARLSYQNVDGSVRGNESEWLVSPKRNRRSVWNINTKPFKGAHFAVFPEALVEPCVRAATSEMGVCPGCGKPWFRLIEKTDVPDPRSKGSRFDVGKTGTNGGARVQVGERTLSRVLGWVPSCGCGQAPIPATVLDPFFGAGTVGVVAKKLGRHYVGIELNPEYCEIARRRISAIPVRLTVCGVEAV